MSSRPGPTFASGWLPGLVLGAVSGGAWLSLGMLIFPLALASLLLIAWKGPRLPGFAGFLTGAGLIWTALFLRVALTCGGPLDTGANGTCDVGDLTGWIAVAFGMFAAGLAASAYALRRMQTR